MFLCVVQVISSKDVNYDIDNYQDIDNNCQGINDNYHGIYDNTQGVSENYQVAFITTNIPNVINDGM